MKTKDMSKERKYYPKEFKLTTIYLIKSKKFKPKEVFEIFGVDRQTVYRWLKKYEKYGDSTFKNKEVLLSPNIKCLQKENANLIRENEKLKNRSKTLQKKIIILTYLKFYITYLYNFITFIIYNKFTSFKQKSFKN